MVPGNQDGSRIVRSWSDPSRTSTCDQLHLTEDGRVWISGPNLPDRSQATCPPIRGTIIGNRIF